MSPGKAKFSEAASVLMTLALKAWGQRLSTKLTGNSATAHDAYRKLLALSKPVDPARPNSPRPGPI